MQNAIIMRHGLAENNHADGDISRCLTASGKMGVKKIAEQLNQFCNDNSLVVSRIGHSPFKRTTETASIVCNCLAEAGSLKSDAGLSISLEPEDDLVPSAKTVNLLNDWRETSENELAIIVTHQPFISQLISKLITGDVSHAEQYPMYPSDAVFVSGEFFSAGLMTLQKKFSIISQ